MFKKLLLFFSLILLLDSSALAEIYSSISGTVIGEDTQQGLNDVTVVALKVETQNYFQAKTDAKGKYVLTNLSPGTYKIGFEKSDYISTNPYYEVVLPKGKNVVNVNHIMERGGSVSGAVYKADGVTPMTDVKITVEVHDAPAADVVYFRGQFTDTAGKFFLQGLPESNNCVVIVEILGRAAITKKITIAKNNITKEVNFVIRDDDITGISGTVRSASGALPEYWAGIILWDSSGKAIAQGKADETGRYSVIGVPPGIYKVTAVWQVVFPKPGDLIDKPGVLVGKGNQQR